MLRRIRHGHWLGGRRLWDSADAERLQQMDGTRQCWSGQAHASESDISLRRLLGIQGIDAMYRRWTLNEGEGS
jgi:hypothetical protein